MLLLASLALLSGHAAELGGFIDHGPTIQPIVVNLYAGDERVASAQVDLFGKYSLVSPPGDYWLQILVGGQEERLERVKLRLGSWTRDFELGLGALADDAWAAIPRAPVRDRALTSARHEPSTRGEHLRPTRDREPRPAREEGA